ncbi:MAG: segregation/condensation protein A [Actinobacteria bacterium]|nr:MAG: segregation/condensation protein A [Actinomycetota bacterium]
MTYQVRTEVFEGPFDLLLHLISKRELDIYDVSLAAITEEYLEHLKQMVDIDLEVATEFLIVAATLIELKASRLLPGPPRDDDSIDVSDRDLLIARLLEYRAFKEASARLAELMAASAGYVGRAAGPGEEFSRLAPDLLARVSPARFAEIAFRVLAPKAIPHVDISHITQIRVSVAEAIEDVRAMLRTRKRAKFRQLTKDTDHRLKVIVRFLAVLELVKRGEADVVQSGSFGEIDVEWLGESAAATSVLADEYDGTWVEGEAPHAKDGSGDIVLDAMIALDEDGTRTPGRATDDVPDGGERT